MKPVHLTAVIAAVATLFIVIAGTATSSGQQAGDRGAQNHGAEQLNVEPPTHGVAILRPTQGSDVHGIVVLQQRGSALHLTGKVTGLEPGLHGFHIHEYGDLRDPEGKSAGAHFNPGNEPHGGPDDPQHHAGDLGNIEAGQDGTAEVDIEAPWLKLHYVVGRSLVVHQDPDDLKSQPSGDAGDRMALGVIGIAGPPSDRQATR